MMTMKSAAIFALLASQVNAQCDFSKDYGTANGDLENLNAVTFYVEAGAAATCRLTCGSGSDTRLAMRFGSEPGNFGNDADESTDGCELTVSASTDDRTQILGLLVESTNYVDLRLTCTCTIAWDPTPGGADVSDLSCFSGSTDVQVQGKGDVMMQDLQVGDNVLTGKGTFQPVYSFGHRHEDLQGEFLQIYTDDDKKPLEMTGSHLLFVDNEAIRADEVKVGDQLVKSSGTAASVTKISTVTKKGLYMPLTPDGSIVVDGGLVASTYVSIQEDAPKVITDASSFFGLSEHKLSHWWLSPYRMMCMGVSSNYCHNTHNDEGILNWLLAGRQMAQFLEPLGFVVSMVLVGLPLFLVFAGLNIIETLLGGPAWAPLLAATVGVGVACSLASRRQSAALTKKMV